MLYVSSFDWFMGIDGYFIFGCCFQYFVVMVDYLLAMVVFFGWDDFIYVVGFYVVDVQVLYKGVGSIELLFVGMWGS